MKNKNKFNLILFLPCLIAGVFVFAENSLAINLPTLIINEVLLAGEKSTKEEFIEIYNYGTADIDLKSLPLKLHIVSSTKNDSGKTLTFTNTNISAKKYFLITSKEYALSNPAITPDATYSTSGNSLVSDGAVYISTSITDMESIISSLGFGKNTYFTNNIFPNPKNNISLERINYLDDDWQESYINNGTPGAENFTGDDVAPPEIPKEEPEEITEVSASTDTLQINEILPYPSNGDNEFIELYNPSTEDADLSAWILRDGSKTGKYIFPADTIIAAQDYLVVYKKDFKFALNNSGFESVTLYNPEEKIISTLTYTGAKKDISYNFDGSNWRWSKFLTPGATNIFNNLPTSKTEVPEKIYKNTYADFSAKGADKDNDNLKYTWDFGDDHKSYLPETHHKYEKTGEYVVTLKIFDGSEEELKTFQVVVENFPTLDVNIIGLSPNPTGVDTDVEYILLKNATKKKINLNGWSIATASKKDFVNHPINLNLILKPKQEFKLTHRYSKFSLNNTSAKIELRYPNGKVASHVAYKSPDKAIPDDATYEKIKGGWTWKLPFVQPKKISSKISIEPSAEVSIQQPAVKTAEQLAREAEVAKNLGNFSPMPEIENKKQTKFSLLNFGLHINTATAFSETTSISNHTKIQDSPTRKHWAVKLYDDFFSKINLFITNFFFKITRLF